MEFREFGVFEIKKRAARKARNPRTGEQVDVPGKVVVHFKAGRMMKDLAQRSVASPAGGAAVAPVARKAPLTPGVAVPPAMIKKPAPKAADATAPGG